MNKYPHYHKPVEGLKTVDVYRVLELFEVNDHAVGHAVKKLLCAGKRGGKDFETDIREAVDTLNRRLQMIAEDDGCKRIEATDKDGFRNWAGHIMPPCPYDSIVTVRFADGNQVIGPAGNMKWIHLGKPTDIVGWKYASEDIKPKWNDHDGGPIPCAPEAWVEITRRDGQIYEHQAKEIRWEYKDSLMDRYQVVQWRYAKDPRPTPNAS